MALSLPATEETALNMTPMIDICFQLVTFFLLTLHFATPEDRIDAAMPRDVGPVPIYRLDDRPKLKVKLFREHATDPDAARTLVRVGNSATIELPKGVLPPDDPVRARLTAAIRALHERLAAAGDVRPVIDAPPPTGAMVPYGDVIAVLDAFLAADLTEVAFEGTPLTPSMKD